MCAQVRHSFAEAADAVLLGEGSSCDEKVRIMCITRRQRYTQHKPTTHILVVCGDSGVHACSCTLLASSGLVCKHYCAYLGKKNRMEQFCASSLHPRWLVVGEEQLLQARASASEEEPATSAFTASMALLQRLLQAETAQTGVAMTYVEPAKVNAQVRHCDVMCPHTWHQHRVTACHAY
jgi:hypothetical protein